jgi:glycosyltransferase involved in cell wall biosynthesis
MKELLYICKFNPFETYGGAAIRNRAIIGLLSRKYRVHVVCFSSFGHHGFDAERNVYCVNDRPSVLRGVLTGQSISEARFHSASLANLIADLTRARDVNVAYFSELVMFQYLRDCFHWSKPRIVLDCHNVECELVREARPYQSWWEQAIFRLEYFPLRLFEKRAMQEADVIVFVSEEDREVAASHFGVSRDKTVVVPNCPEMTQAGQEPSFKQDGGGDELRRFAIVGTLDWHANRIGIKWFIREIWDKYASMSTRAELYLIGKKYRKNSDFAGKRISQFCNVPNIAHTLEPVDVCIAPLLYGGGSRLKILEYFYNQKPVVATSVAARGLEIHPGIHYLRAESYTEFKNAVELLLDRDLRNQLIMNGLNLLKSKYHIDLYERVLLDAV